MSEAAIPPAARPLPLVRALWRGIWRAARSSTNLALLVAFQLFFGALSAAAPRNASVAHAHAAALINLERRLHLFAEPDVQYAALHFKPTALFGAVFDGDSVRHLARIVYAGGHLSWLVSMLLWLYLFRRKEFIRVRNVVVISTFIAIEVATIYPVAPPRFALAGAPYHVEDVTGIAFPEQVLVRLSRSDPYASTPSGHTLWALLTGLGLYLGAARRRNRLLSLGFPAVMVVTVVLTGNHYFLDCLASVALFGSCLLAQCIWERLRPQQPAAFAGTERRHPSNLRALDYPLVLCTCAATVLIIAVDPAQQLIGILLLGACIASVLVARRWAAAGTSLAQSAPEWEWWCGLLFVVGATTVYASDAQFRLFGALLWLAAAGCILFARLEPIFRRTAFPG